MEAISVCFVTGSLKPFRVLWLWKGGSLFSKTPKGTPDTISAPYTHVTRTGINRRVVHTRVLLSTCKVDSLLLLSGSKVKTSTQRLSVMVGSSSLT